MKLTEQLNPYRQREGRKDDTERRIGDTLSPVPALKLLLGHSTDHQQLASVHPVQSSGGRLLLFSGVYKQTIVIMKLGSESN